MTNTNTIYLSVMFVLHKMASSATHHPLFTSSLKLPSTTNPISKHYLNPKKLQSFYLFKKPHFHRFSASPSAVATDPSTTVDKNLAENDAPVEKVVLPTNESSNKLLRIRHTVISVPFCYFWFLLLFCLIYGGVCLSLFDGLLSLFSF